MKYVKVFLKLLTLTVTITVIGCSTVDYDLAKQRDPDSLPLSILVIAPLNNSNDLQASYSYLATVSKPLAEAGYYVLPVAVTDTFLKENGLTDPYVMRQVPLSKYREILDADAVLFITIDRYGQEYNIISSKTIVSAKAELALTDSQEVIWRGSTRVSRSSGASESVAETLVNAVFTQIVNANKDGAHKLSREANWDLFHGGSGLPEGPRKYCYENGTCSY